MGSRTEYWDRASGEDILLCHFVTAVVFRCGEVLPPWLPIPRYPTPSIPLLQSGHAREESGIQCTTQCLLIAVKESNCFHPHKGNSLTTSKTRNTRGHIAAATLFNNDVVKVRG